MLIIGGITFGLLFLQKSSVDIQKKQEEEQTCAIEKKLYTVRGVSMSPVIHQEEDITMYEGYYDCNPVEHGDIVAYQYAGNKNPIIKFVKAIPGDAFTLRRKDDNAVWNIVINGAIVKNSEGKEYEIDEREQKMLSLYITDYKGHIPEGAYLLLGNTYTGSMDSTEFGFASGKNIMGKVVRIHQ